MSESAFKNAKYEATGETKVWLGQTLHRIRAVAAIAAFSVLPGDLGGWIENENNLEISGNAWISGNAKIFGNAQISGNAKISGNARISGNAWISGNAQIYGNARILFKCSKTPNCISGLRWHITITDANIQIGCQGHETAKWAKFSNAIIDKMDSDALEFWKEHKKTILALAAAHQKDILNVDA